MRWRMIVVIHRDNDNSFEASFKEVHFLLSIVY